MGCPVETTIGDDLVFSVCTHNSDTGELTDADAKPIYRIYEDETEAPILTGTLSKLDNLNTTGFYTEEIACTLVNGFEDGKTYTIYVTATVDTATGGISFAFKAVTEPSGGGLTAQQIRDAMKLAPTVGAAASGSVDKHLDDIQAKTNLLTAGMVTIVSPVNMSGSKLILIRGDDYKIVDDRAIQFTNAGWPDVTGAAVTLTIRLKSTRMSELTVAGAIVDASTCRFELTHALTDAMTPTSEGHIFDVEAILANGNYVTLALGDCTVLEDVTR